MAKLRMKKQRRQRAQFTMGQMLGQRHSIIMQRAKEMRVEIDFSADFETWFSKQLDQVEQELSKLQEPEVPKQAVQGTVASSATTTTMVANDGLTFA